MKAKDTDLKQIIADYFSEGEESRLFAQGKKGPAANEDKESEWCTVTTELLLGEKHGDKN